MTTSQTPDFEELAKMNVWPNLPIAITFKQVFARTMVVEWEPSIQPDINSDNSTPVQSPKILYQVSKSQSKSGVFTIVYEGENTSCELRALIPSTLYTIKIRTMFNAQREWTPSYISAQTSTTDETELVNAYVELIRAIKDNKIASIYQIIKNQGAQIDYNTRDKTGSTLLMVIFLINLDRMPNQYTRYHKVVIITRCIHQRNHQIREKRTIDFSHIRKLESC